MNYGVSEFGFLKKTFTVIKDEMITDLRAVFGAALDCSDDTVLGQMLSLIAYYRSEGWDLDEAIYQSFSPSSAIGAPLSRLVVINGIKRFEATKTTDTLTVVSVAGSEGKVIPAGFQVNVKGTTNTFITLQDQEILPNGKAYIPVQCMDYGKIESPAGTLTEIVTPLPFITECYNENAGLTGRNEETDTELRLRREQTLSVGGTGTIDAIYSAIRNIQDVREAKVLENATEDNGYTRYLPKTGKISAVENTFIITGIDTKFLQELDVGYSIKFQDDTDSYNERIITEITSDTQLKVRNKIINSVTEKSLEASEITMPPNSFQVVVIGGSSQDIIKAIWLNKPGGIRPFGNVFDTFTDSQGVERNIYYRRPDEINIYIKADISVDENFPVDGVEKIKTCLESYGSVFSIGQDVIQYKLNCVIGTINGVVNINQIFIGTTINPTDRKNIVISDTEVAKFNRDRISVTIS